MKRLHTFDFWQRPLAGLFRDLLGTEGIACLIRNEQLSCAAGEIPFTECYPELWVIDDEIYPRARLLLDNLLSTSHTAAAWHCPGCGEFCEGQFDVCWSCGQTRDG